jgi:hypothetical protein
MKRDGRKGSTAPQPGLLLEDGRIVFAHVDRDEFGVDGLLDEDSLVDRRRTAHPG